MLLLVFAESGSQSPQCGFELLAAGQLLMTTVDWSEEGGGLWSSKAELSTRYCSSQMGFWRRNRLPV